jgi:hypothetical protein
VSPARQALRGPCYYAHETLHENPATKLISMEEGGRVSEGSNIERAHRLTEPGEDRAELARMPWRGLIESRRLSCSPLWRSQPPGAPTVLFLLDESAVRDVAVPLRSEERIGAPISSNLPAVERTLARWAPPILISDGAHP